ncbi:MAG: bifunctional YncE family protein/alkaline phosphatase family protein [Gemmatimonadales bacterium]
MLPLLLLLQQPPQPRRVVPDSGVVVNNQQVTPAGVQSVFADRVMGVRFGKTPDEIWVSVHGAVYRLSWRDNATVTSATLDGRAGVQGVAVDRLSGRAYVTTVGRLPADIARSRIPGSEQLARTQSVAHLLAYDNDSGAVRFASPALGDYIAGSPALARRANRSGHRVIVVPLPANDSLAVLDADDGSLLRKIGLGVLPVAAVVREDGAVAYVTNLGGRKPRRGDRAARQCCDPFAELVRVDARGIAQPGSVTKIDLVAGAVTRVISVGRHPTGIAWDERSARLYVANSNSDTVSVIDTRRDSVIGAIAIAPFRERKIGFAPTAVALSPDAATLYVTIGGINAVALYALPGGRFRGLIPTGWYPSSVDVSADGHTLAVGTLFGVGSGQGRNVGLTGRYVHSYRGSVNVIAVPTDAELAAYTTAVGRNNRLTFPRDSAIATRARPDVPARAVPERPGEPSLIDHVVYIIRENRTYDQILGDMGRGASDTAFVQYGRDVTPNAHALADQFVLLDHFFASGGNSADGHNWATQANETEYPMWPLYLGRSYPSEGDDPLAYSAGGFLWEAARSKGKTVTVFGEYAPGPVDYSPTVRSHVLAQYRDSQPHNPALFRGILTRMYNTRSNIPSLDQLLVREYPGWTMGVPDVAKADVLLDHLREWEARGAMPNLVIMDLPSDHTEGTSPDWCTPRACVADNDLALGRIVEGLSHSTFWKSMAILIMEDDAQNGVDHIDGHRTVALVASPFARRGAIEPTFYNQQSMVKTIELMLGLPALSMFDLVATDMRASFIEPSASPDVAPYTALEPRQSLYEVNQRVGAITGPQAPARRRAARASSSMNFRDPDAAPTELLNRILWHDARGWSTAYPAVQHSLFFPLAVDIEDDEREARPDR